jgi:hypothetical protein
VLADARVHVVVGTAARTEVLFQIGAWGEVEDSHDVDAEDIRVRLASAALFAQCLPGGHHDVVPIPAAAVPT